MKHVLCFDDKLTRDHVARIPIYTMLLNYNENKESRLRYISDIRSEHHVRIISQKIWIVTLEFPLHSSINLLKFLWYH